jgi:hypothetical protein
MDKDQNVPGNNRILNIHKTNRHRVRLTKIEEGHVM